MPGALEGKRILLVDDDKDILAAMESALKDEGPELLTARDGNEAIAAAQEREPDLVVLDMMLPKRSGFLVMEKLKRERQEGKMPRVIMITANLGQRHKQYAQSLGIDEYLNKPFRMEKLVELAKKLLG